MPTYKHGKSARRISNRPLVIIFALIFLVMLGLYYFFIVQNKTSLRNNNNPLVSNVKTSKTSTDIDEATFKVSLFFP
ncbi:hypothetical protein KW789_02645, partial [Candidatus Saccharibacteria bacterium]|nr:hypothetical protein [Candidatus Saccharibacteria bacterium]